MSTGAQAKSGLTHVAALYGSDDEFLDAVVPFLADGLAEGQPTLLGVEPRLDRLVREELGDAADEVMTLRRAEQYERPLDALRHNRDLFAAHAAAGAPAIRVVGDVPHPGVGAPWDGWVRYEAAINHFCAELPVMVLCPYADNTPDSVLADVESTHGWLALPGHDHQPNPHYTEPATFLSERADWEVAPLERTRPDLRLENPTLAHARHVVGVLAANTDLDERCVSDLVVGVSEAVTNAKVHGKPPVLLRAWVNRNRVAVAVSDCGSGPRNPFAGLLPDERRRSQGGLGLWLAHQLCDRVTLAVTEEGFTAYLVIGEPPPVEMRAKPALSR
ncbi:anti-sigma regulatory factor (Ser/Thr protein kinase) [Saccharomonospora marina XMU15]|uniref:Anti-sigma regulatory factor (Ser/Thr protein kinase) n=1 Tax=Saccharomonospora marina XMU15 TaxID=882083 RepID=H5X1L6_9PSEU|nr:sensor histidine kinase [Saccharomonospora marina]EHR50879.1 anti-sigma regulatory factor (Ser/Thr protein kinase) [Saccharomonospora marina XMU15]